MVLVLGLLAVSIVMADESSDSLAKEAGVGETTVPTPRDPDAVLYDQTDNPGTNGFPSQRFPDFGDDVLQGADDFVVPAGVSWEIEVVAALGSYSANGGPTPDWEVYFYEDDAGLPGTEVYSATGLAGDDVAGDVVITLTVPAVLGEGTYWLSIMSNMPFGTSGQWFWSTRAISTNNPYAWRDPGGLIGTTGCDAWDYGASACGVGGGVDPDALFLLEGTVGAPFADMAFDKTVGLDPSVCAATDEITIPAGMGGTEVTYCYTMDNTGDADLDYHTVVDDQLGTLLDDFAYQLTPGGSVFFTYTANITQTTVNEAVWYVTDEAGGPVIDATDTATVTQQTPTSVALSGFEAESTNFLLPAMFVALVAMVAGAGLVLRRKSGA